jgi:adenine phosphoribosyltransferase
MKAHSRHTKKQIDLKSELRIIPGFPRPDVKFVDITTLLKNPNAFEFVINRMTEEIRHRRVNAILGIEARGFMLGAPIAYNLGLGFIPARKEGKLPAKKVIEEYSLEYGTQRLEMHADALSPGQKVAIVDDLLATGGTARASATLVERMGASVSCIGFLVELDRLGGRQKIRNYDVFSLVHLDL